MSIDFGPVPIGAVLPVFFATYGKTNGESITLTGLAVTDIEIYKGTSTTQRASDAGYTLLDTDGIDFDTITGIHGFSIDTGDNTDAGFYASGSYYTVIVSAVTVDSQTVNFIAATFRCVTAEGVAGQPKVDTAAIAGTAVNTGSAQLGVNVVNAAGTAWGSGAITAASIAADAITAAKIADGAIDANTFAAGAITASAIAADAIGASELAADAVAEIADAIWDEDATAHQTQGTFGQAIGDPVADANTIYAAVVTGATGATIAADIITIDDFLDTEVAAIKAKTDSLTFSTALRVDAQVFGMEAGTVTAAAVATGAIDADAIADNAIDAGAIAADAITAAKIAAGALDGPTFTASVGSFTIGVGSSTTSIVMSSITPASAVNDQFNGRIMIFDNATTTAALRGQATDITDWVHATTTATVTALTTAPSSGDTGHIL